MGFKVFEKTRTKSGPPSVTLGKYGHLALNSVAMRLFFSTSKYVHLLWDPDEHRLGIKPVVKPDRNTYQISKGTGANTGSISGKSFLKFVGHPKGVSLSLVLTWNDKEGLAECVVGPPGTQSKDGAPRGSGRGRFRRGT